MRTFAVVNDFLLFGFFSVFLLLMSGGLGLAIALLRRLIVIERKLDSQVKGHFHLVLRRMGDILRHNGSGKELKELEVILDKLDYREDLELTDEEEQRLRELLQERAESIDESMSTGEKEVAQVFLAFLELARREINNPGVFREAEGASST